MAYLYDTLIKEFGKRELGRTEVPNYISDNIKYDIRPYQAESFKRFMLCYNEDFDAKPNRPFHLLYNMATGSGKTLIMAGLMLYLACCKAPLYRLVTVMGLRKETLTLHGPLLLSLEDPRQPFKVIKL